MSTQTLRFISPQSSSGSFLISMMIHGALALALVGILGSNLSIPSAQEEFVDLGYQTFDEPPPPAPQESRVRQAPEPSQVATKLAPPAATSELHDEKGEVAGSQEAAQETKVSSEGQGQAISTPYYRIKPKYPKAALVSGTEGWVLMKVDIDESGAVDNIRVVDGEQRNLFQSEARRAVSQWKYRPFTDDSGKPFRKTDHQVRVDFKLKEVSSVE